MFKSQSKGRSAKQDKINPLRASEKMAPEWKSLNIKVYIPTQCVGWTGDGHRGLEANLQTLNCKWLGSGQYEFNKMFGDTGGAVCLCTVAVLCN